MPCFKPLKAFPNPKGGKPLFTRPEGHSGRTVDIPCGQCIGCRIDRSSDWAARIVHETHSWEWSWFLTLTYSDEFLPADGSIQKREMVLFFKRLREAARKAGLLQGSNVRKFYNGEYGSSTQRPHYHAVVFGLSLNDLKLWRKNERGDQLWTSDFLESVWGKGRVIVGSVSLASAGYVAGYCLRDTLAKHSPYGFIDPDTGELCERVPPFVGMSRNKGIGNQYFQQFGHQLEAGDFVVIDGSKRPTPKYYRNLFADSNPVIAARLKAEREAFVSSPKAKRERRPSRLIAREEVTKAKRSIRRVGSAGAV